MKKRLSAIMMCIVMLLSVLFASMLSASASVANDACNSVVVVCVCFNSDEYGMLAVGNGTGFFVGNEGTDPQYLITNHHVIDAYEQAGHGERTVITIDDTKLTGRALIKVFYDSEDSEEAYIVEANSIKDVAVLKLASPTSKRVPLKVCEPTNDMKGTQIYAIGYPSVADNKLVAATTNWGKDDASVTSGVFGKMFTETGTGGSVIQIDVNTSNGNSGGPVINENGDVIGIATSSYMSQTIHESGVIETENVNYAMNISEAVFYLNRNDIAFDTATFGSNDAGSSNQSTDETTQQSTVNENNNSEHNTQKTGGDDNKGLIITLIAIIVVLVLGGGITIIVLVINKNKKDVTKAADEAKAMAAAAVAQANTKKAYVRSLAAQHGNARIKMTSGMEIVVGRSHDCKISFIDSTPGISGKHCSVSYDEASRSFILKDLKSTYGTFLQDGTKLTPNTPYRLRSGDRFYLGDKANTLCVELE